MQFSLYYIITHYGLKLTRSLQNTLRLTEAMQKKNENERNVTCVHTLHS